MPKTVQLFQRRQGRWGFLWLLTLGMSGLTVSNPAIAQLDLLPDNSLGTRVEAETVERDRIRGGTQSGINLFHSFTEFNVQQGHAVYFDNPTGVENIISRVTGSDPSDILGTLGVQGGANLYLLNPNGIVFGENLRLDLRGSFIATTADGLEFGNQGQFTTNLAEASPVLLTIAPSALLFNQLTPQPISQQSRLVTPQSSLDVGLQVPEGESLLLAGGNVLIRGGLLNAPQGQLTLGAIHAPARVEIQSVDGLLGLNFSGVAARGNVELGNGAIAQAIDGGNVHLFGRRIRIGDGTHVVTNTRSQPGGQLVIDASRSLTLNGLSNLRVSGLFNQSLGTGNSGDIIIQTRRLTLRDGAQISVGAFAAGNGGNLDVQVADRVSISGRGQTSKNEFPSGLFTRAERRATGNAGNLNLVTQRLSIRESGQISASTLGEGNGGQIRIAAADAVTLQGLNFEGRRFTGILSTTSGASGNAGNVRITTQRFTAEDGAVASASTVRGATGRGGNLSVLASDAVELRGATPDGQFQGGLLVGTNGSNRGGDLRIVTDRLLVQDGARLSAGTTNLGRGGRLTVNASEIEVAGRSPNNPTLVSTLLSSASETSGGNAGNLTIRSDRLLVQDGGALTVSNAGTGRAGTLAIAANVIDLNNGTLLAETQAQSGANIRLRSVDLLLMNNGSTISAQAFQNANGGNIAIAAPTGFLVAGALENNDIIANANLGNGGQIDITTQGILGLQIRRELTRFSDISASSRFGIDGEVILNTPDVEPGEGLVELPTGLVDASQLVARSCASTAADRSLGEFLVTGRGGLPTFPEQSRSSVAERSDWATLETSERSSVVQPASNEYEDRSVENAIASSAALSANPLVEAQGWHISESGDVALTHTAKPALNSGVEAVSSIVNPPDSGPGCDR